MIRKDYILPYLFSFAPLRLFKLKSDIFCDISPDIRVTSSDNESNIDIIDSE